MPNIICNPNFVDGLTCWTQSGGVEVGEVPFVGTRVRAAKIPRNGVLAQHLGDWTTTHDLHFWWLSLATSSPALDVRVNYTDGTHQTYELRSGCFSSHPDMCWPDLEVDNSKRARSFQLTNVGSGTNGVIYFELRGEPARPCVCVPYGIRAYNPWGLYWLHHHHLPPDDENMLAARFFELDLKLEKILELLRSKQRPPVTKPSGKPTTKK